MTGNCVSVGHASACHGEQSSPTIGQAKACPTKTLLCLLLPALALGQANLKFQEGRPGEVPPGWFVLGGAKSSGYLATWQSEGCHGATACALLAAPDSPAPEGFGTLMQSFPATAFRGRTVRLRAWIRLAPKAQGDRAQMLLHVARPNLQPGFADNMANRPIVTD